MAQTETWRIPGWFKDLSEKQLSQLKFFHSELIRFNGKINLISPRTERSADLIHIADGIIASLAILAKDAATNIYDLGSGNGVPGIILAILAQERKIHLVDADMRKCEFLKHLIAKSSLTNAAVHHKRIEDIPEGTIECAVTRGLAAISRVLVLCRKSLAPKGRIYHLKSEAWSTEIAEIPSQVMAYWTPHHLLDYKLPITEAVYSIVQTTKK